MLLALFHPLLIRFAPGPVGAFPPNGIVVGEHVAQMFRKAIADAQRDQRSRASENDLLSTMAGMLGGGA